MLEQAKMLYGDDWDSEEFQTALKVVIKCEIQALLARLSETGEETVLLTASATELCTGHLASPKAINFVNTLDVGNIKNKFLKYITGTSSTPVTTTVNKTVPVGADTSGTVKAPEIPAFLFNNYPAGGMNTNPNMKPPDTKTLSVINQTKTVEKRPLPMTIQTSQALMNDPKRRKTETVVPSLAPVVPSLARNSPVTVSSSPSSSMASSLQQPKLKTTKVVSKSGGFTEERLSQAEFQKMLAQYKGGQSKGAVDNKLTTGTQAQQKQLLVSAGTSKINKPVTVVSSVPVSQNVGNQSVTHTAVKKVTETVLTNTSQSDKTVTEKRCELNKENQPSQVGAKAVTEKGTDKGPSEKDKAAMKQVDKDNPKEKIDNIDSLDTETLIRMTKQKHLENMSDADREIQAKLGKLSSKLSWVVEYSEEGKDSKSKPGQASSNIKGPTSVGVARPPPRPFQATPYMDQDDEELDEEDYDEDEEEDGEFNEDDLDEEDKATLRAMREAHMRKFGNSGNMEGMEGFPDDGRLYNQGYNVVEGYAMNQGGYYENYEGEEGEYNEEYGEYGEEGETPGMPGMMVAGSNMMLAGAQGTNIPPEAENFQFIGPMMAKCLICNKIIRKTEMKSHNDHHMKEFEEEEATAEKEDEMEEMEEMEEMDEMEEMEGEGEELQEMEGEDDEGDYHEEEEEGYTEEQEGEGQGQDEYQENFEGQGEQEGDLEPEFTAEKFVAEKLVAEKLDIPTDTASMCSDDSKNHVCEICNKSYKNNSNLLRHHKKMHATNKDSSEIQCPCCTKTFKTAMNFQKHLKKVHPDYDKTSAGESSTAGDSNDSSDTYSCGICGTVLPSEQILKEHMETHTT